MAKDSKETDPLTEFAKGLGDKAPTSIKEIAKVLVEMTSRFIEAMNKLTATVTALVPQPVISKRSLLLSRLQ
ncbi:hypothetical protein HPB48_021442 [Haemaphysalis longicornis]|uniref:Uncharacterized protein n=1 Tax=Haemaphysalis longicornis TaxID=44386 RepID=A0A9J6GYP3_HAELO|nr:hypothetical protein HPB48_021442 [Haemaphysalis longicornis]